MSHPRVWHPLAVLIVTVAVLATACGPAAPTVSPARPSASTPITPTATPSLTVSSEAPTPNATAALTVAPSASPAAAGSFDPIGQTIAAEIVVAGLTAPVDVTNAGDGSGRLFVAEQAGLIRIVRDGVSLGLPFLDIGGRIASGGERGLLGLAFHPDYPTDQRLFVDYTDLRGNTVIASYTVDPSDPDRALPDSETIILRISQPYPNHNGGAVAFGPDGKLYIAMGDGGAGGDPQGNGQRVDTLLAKILRIDIDGEGPPGQPYAIPPDNPFVGRPPARPEIWLTGLRNPWRMRFDRATGDLWIGDVGQNAWEEVDVARSGVGGLDFGWNTMEGFHCYLPSSGCDQRDLTLPVTEYDHGAGCAVIGGVVVRDARQGRLDGGYLFGDACSDTVWLIDPVGDGRRTPVVVTKLGRSLSSIGEGEDGTVCATSLSRGELLRFSGVSPAGT